MNILLNGKNKEIDDNISLDQFLSAVLSSDRGVIIELNGKVVKKGKRGEFLLKEGDKLELIRFMGGG